MVKKNCKDTITRFDSIHERDRRTDGQTDGRTDGRTPHDGIGRASTASRGKKEDYRPINLCLGNDRRLAYYSVRLIGSRTWAFD